MILVYYDIMLRLFRRNDIFTTPVHQVISYIICWIADIRIATIKI